MARTAKPWRRKGRSGWWAKVNGRTLRLADTERQARVELARLLARPGVRARVAVVELIDLWLDAKRREVKPVTWRNYRFYGQSFVDRYGRLLAEDICEHHVDSWLDGHEGWGGSRPLARTLICMCWRFGRRKKYIAVNELADMRGKGISARKPAEPGAVEKLVDGILDAEFADLYRFMVAVGCRPGEARTLRAELVNLDERTAVVDGKKGLRPVALPDAAVGPLRRALARHPSGFLFRSRRGLPWGMSGLSSQVRMARRRLGLPENLVAYHARGNFATRAYAAGAELGDIARCLGHNDTERLTTLFKHYLNADPNRLRAVAEKANADVIGPGHASSPPAGTTEHPSPPARRRRKPPGPKAES